jgi:hypothetical protein
MFAKLAQHLTNGRNRALPHRPAALLKLVVNSQVKAAIRPQRRRLRLVCRWRALRGDAALTCAWGIEALDRVDQPVGLARRPAAVLVVGDDTSARLRPDEIAVAP